MIQAKRAPDPDRFRGAKRRWLLTDAVPSKPVPRLGVTLLGGLHCGLADFLPLADRQDVGQRRPVVSLGLADRSARTSRIAGFESPALLVVLRRSGLRQNRFGRFSSFGKNPSLFTGDCLNKKGSPCEFTRGKPSGQLWAIWLCSYSCSRYDSLPKNSVFFSPLRYSIPPLATRTTPLRRSHVENRTACKVSVPCLKSSSLRVVFDRSVLNLGGESTTLTYSILRREKLVGSTVITGRTCSANAKRISGS